MLWQMSLTAPDARLCTCVSPPPFFLLCIMLSHMTGLGTIQVQEAPYLVKRRGLCTNAAVPAASEGVYQPAPSVCCCSVFTAAETNKTQSTRMKRLSLLTFMSWLKDLLLQRREMQRGDWVKHTVCMCVCVCVAVSASETTPPSVATLSLINFAIKFKPWNFFKEEAEIRGVQMLICLQLVSFLYAGGF